MMRERKRKENHKKESGEVARVMTVSVEAIKPNPGQPRRFFTEEAILRLADSIRIHGFIQPLCVRRPDGDEREGIWELVAGERRLRAAKRLGLSSVPCIEVKANREESAHMAIVENIQREDLNMFEQAEAIKALMSLHCLTQEKIAQTLSCSQSYVANKLRLLRFKDNEREEILAASLSERHARALLRIGDEEARISAAHTVIRKEMTVAETEEYIDRIVEAGKKEQAKEKKERRTKLVIKDVKILYNTIDKAVETVRLSGVDVQTLRRETAKDTEIVIRIPRYA